MKSLAFVLVVLLHTPLISLAQSEPQFNFTLIKPRLSNEPIYEDKIIQVVFIIGDKLQFILKNKTSDAIEIDWTRVSFVDPYGGAHRVIHEGVRYIERDKPVPPSVIPPNATLSDIAHPSDYIKYNSNLGWIMDDLLPGKRAYYENKTFSLFLPVKVKGVFKNYNFMFKVVRESKVETEKRYAQKVKEESIGLNKLTQLTITRSDLGANWPFTIESGILACYGKTFPAVFFIANDKVYALNGTAIDKIVGGKTATLDITEIQGSNPRGGKMSIVPLIDKGASLCK